MAARIHAAAGRSVRVVVSRCVVMQPAGGGFCDTLINPANERLVGTKFPYFPKGGPVPEDKVVGAAATQRDWVPPGFVSKWGGMEIGSEMMYPVQTVDGLVGMLGGDALRRECSRLPARGGSDVRCPPGEAVRTSAAGGLSKLFGCIVHTVPPFYATDAAGRPSAEWRALLRSCWLRALEEAGPGPLIAAPLLGAGARGAPIGEACRVAAGAVASWLLRAPAPDPPPGGRSLYLAVQTEETAALLARQIEEALAAAAAELPAETVPADRARLRSSPSSTGAAAAT